MTTIPFGYELLIIQLGQFPPKLFTYWLCWAENYPTTNGQQLCFAIFSQFSLNFFVRISPSTWNKFLQIPKFHGCLQRRQLLAFFHHSKKVWNFFGQILSKRRKTFRISLGGDSSCFTPEILHEKKTNQTFPSLQLASKTAMKAAILIQRWYRRFLARIEIRRRYTWTIFQSIEYAGEQDQVRVSEWAKWSEFVGG